MKALVSVRYERPPHLLLADLDAFNVDRLLTKTGRGAFVFNVVTANLHREVIQEGRLVVIESTESIQPYIGVIRQTEEDAAAGTVEVSGDNYVGVTYGLALDKSAPHNNADAASIAERLLANAQGMGRSVFLRMASGAGSNLTSQIDFGTQHLGSALDALADRVDDEWWIDHIITRTQITHWLFWAHRRGTYRRDVFLQEGKDFTLASYKRDAIGRVRSAVAVGGGGEIAGRSSVVVAAQPGNASSKATQTIANVTPEKVAQSQSPLIARDLIEMRTLDTSEATLADVARRAYERPLIAAESLALTATLEAVQQVTPGDIVTARFHSVNYGGMVRDIRINAMQPDEDTGECDLDVEVA